MCVNVCVNVSVRVNVQEESKQKLLETESTVPGERHRELRERVAIPAGDREVGSCTSMAELEHLERARGIDSPKIKRQRAESLEETMVDPDPTAMDR